MTSFLNTNKCNYLINNPITFYTPGFDGLSSLGDFTFTGPNNTGLSNGIIAFICLAKIYAKIF